MATDQWEKVERLYHSAAQRSGAERAAYLERECAGDEALRSEVESLLAQDVKSAEFLKAPLSEAARRTDGHSLVGKEIGTYRVSALIGAGGMGEVYLARDAKLGREVAIKVLPKEFAHDGEWQARFRREARMLAALNHPNIATIYGLEQSGEVHYLVMEFVAGESLADRVARGPLPLREALRVAVEVAEALEAAHEKGIVHRDLKPANVKVTPDGKVKVLDFGLAKAFTGDGQADLSRTTTLSAEGKILGTPAYMSPEQARGQAVDKRTDIWAFGCVLYEMLTGKRAFAGENATDILAAVVKSEPDWNRLPENTPSNIRALLRRCLQKDRASRLHDAADARIEIAETLAAPADSLTTPATSGFRRLAHNRLVSGLVMVVGVSVAAIAVWILKPSPPSAPRAVTRFTITLGPGQTLYGPQFAPPEIAISRDGTRIAYSVSQNGAPQMYVRFLDGLGATLVPGTGNALSPFFSPDGQWLGFDDGMTLKKVPLNGGSAVTLGLGTFGTHSWTPQGTILFDSARSSLQQIPDTGGSPRPLWQLEKDEAGERTPVPLPGGKDVLFENDVGSGTGGFRISIRSLKAGERHDLAQGLMPRYVPAGYLVYVQGGDLMAAPLDLKKFVLKGPPVSVVQGVLESPGSLTAQYDVSETGTLVYVPGTVYAPLKMVWVDRKGAEQPIDAPPHTYVLPRISPDGRRLAAGIEEGDAAIWIYDLNRDALTRLTFQGGGNVDPIWTADGKRIVYKGTGNRLFWQPADGSGGQEQLISGQLGTNNVPGSWSPDGQNLVFTEDSPGVRQLWIYSVKDRQAHPFEPNQPPYETSPQFSPDGRWIAYMSLESGRPEVYVRPFPGPGGKWQISTVGGTEPVWNHEGHELFYRSGQNGQKMMSVEYDDRQGFSAGKPKELFEGTYVPTPRSFSDYDVSPDGQKFLMLKVVEGGQPASSEIVVVQNWFEELKQKVPTGKK